MANANKMLSITAVVLMSATGPALSHHRGHGWTPWTGVRSLDGSGNNRQNSAWGQAGSNYLRVAPASYADTLAAPRPGPAARYVSNRIFNDTGQNIFSRNGVTQWGWAWAQFIDHDMGLRDESSGVTMPNPYDRSDRLESFHSDASDIGFNRTPAAPGTGSNGVVRQQVNTVSNYLDGSQIYGSTAPRLAWLRSGAKLLMPDNYLPTSDARGSASAAPVMDLFGAQQGNPSRAVVAGDVRANENVALTAIQTLFAREHNRIVDALPARLSDEDKFQIARRVVGAEVEYITYNEFLPAMGVKLAPYHGYNQNVNPTLSNEFATVGFRGHSMVHGEFDVDEPIGGLPAATLAALAKQGVEITTERDGIELTIPLQVAFGNPGLIQTLGLGPVLGSLSEVEYSNDEQIDNSLRSVLFEVPKPGVDPSKCGEPTSTPDCFAEISDLGADDILRGRDHGMPSYNALRSAYGLAPAHNFRQITGESTDQLPAGLTINSPGILTFTKLFDKAGKPIKLSSPRAQTDAVSGIRGSTVAARLKEIYRNVDDVDAFVGMVSEPHLPGSELGALQNAMWVRQFSALRDGDRYFYLNDPSLSQISNAYGISYQQTLAQIVAADTAGPAVATDLFHAA